MALWLCPGISATVFHSHLAFWELFPALGVQKTMSPLGQYLLCCPRLLFFPWNLLVIYPKWQTVRNASFRRLTKCVSLYHSFLLRNKGKLFIELETFPFKQKQWSTPQGSTNTIHPSASWDPNGERQEYLLFQQFQELHSGRTFHPECLHTLDRQ